MNAKRRVMEATLTVICEAGLPNLSIQRLADELDQSKSAVYHHYDDKHDLLTSFLDYLHHQLKDTIEAVHGDSPEQRLENLIMDLSNIHGEKERNLRVAILSLQAEAPYDEDIAAEFKRIDKTLRSAVQTLYEDMDVQHPEQATTLTLSTIDGVVNRSLCYTEDYDPTDALRDLPQRFQ